MEPTRSAAHGCAPLLIAAAPHSHPGPINASNASVRARLAARRAYGNSLVRPGPASAGHRARLREDVSDDRTEAGQAERLGDHVIGPGEADLLHVRIGAQRREHEHWQRARGVAGADAAAHLDAVNAGHHHIEDGEVERLRLDEAQRLLAV